MENTQSTQAVQISNRPLFHPGAVRFTPGACAEIMERYPDEDACDVAKGFLIRHLGGDWSQMSDDDAQRNREAVVEGERVFSAYWMQLTAECGPGKLWIITEWDRSSTTILLPSEY